jgi:hypothetical protein
MNINRITQVCTCMLQAEEAFLKIKERKLLFLLTDGSSNRKLYSEKVINKKSFNFFLGRQVGAEFEGCC